MPSKTRAGRLAFRVEGDFWNAYWTPESTMSGAILIGSLRMTFAEVPALKDHFMDLVRASFNEIVKQTVGGYATFDEPRPAPEHERGGSA